MSSRVSRDGLSRVFNWEQLHPCYHYRCDAVQSSPSVIYSLSCRGGGLLRSGLFSLSTQGHLSFSLCWHLLWWHNRNSQEICEALAWVQLSHQAQHASLQSTQHFKRPASAEARLWSQITISYYTSTLESPSQHPEWWSCPYTNKSLRCLTVGSGKHYAVVCSGNWGSCVLHEIPFCWEERLAGKQWLLSREYLVDSLQDEVNEPVTSR